MARGSQIIVSSNPRGTFLTGIAGDTSTPGTCMQVQAATAMIGTNFTFIAAAPGTDGKKVLCAIMLANTKNGLSSTSAAAVAGQLIEMYVPAPGEDINIRLGEVAGTANTYAIGDRVIIDAEDGIFVPETGSPQDTPFVVMEAETQVAGGTLTWCRKT